MSYKSNVGKIGLWMHFGLACLISEYYDGLYYIVCYNHDNGEIEEWWVDVASVRV